MGPWFLIQSYWKGCSIPLLAVSNTIRRRVKRRRRVRWTFRFMIEEAVGFDHLLRNRGIQDLPNKGHTAEMPLNLRPIEGLYTTPPKTESSPEDPTVTFLIRDRNSPTEAMPL